MRCRPLFSLHPKGCGEEGILYFCVGLWYAEKTQWGKSTLWCAVICSCRGAGERKKQCRFPDGKRHRGIFRSLVRGAARRLFLKRRREYIVHQQDQLQHAAEMAFHLLLLPDDGTLPTCMLSENNANHKGGKGRGGVVPLPVLSGVGHSWNQGMIKKCPAFHTFLGKAQII